MVDCISEICNYWPVFAVCITVSLAVHTFDVWEKEQREQRRKNWHPY